MDVRTAIQNGDAATLRQLLVEDPSRANTPIHWGKDNGIQSYPLHFVSDMLFEGTVRAGMEQPLVQALIDAGADINHNNGDPLNAAASLGAAKVAFMLLDAGARPDLKGVFGETALHWAATLGADHLVDRLIERGAPIDVKDEKYQATPLGWALHGWGEPPPGSHGRHRDVVVRLVKAGATVEPQWLAGAQMRARPDVLSALRGEP